MSSTLLRMDQSPNQAIAVLVAAQMASHGTTGAALADILGIGEQAVMRRLTAATPFTTTELVKVAHYFSVPVGDLFPCDERVSA